MLKSKTGREMFLQGTQLLKEAGRRAPIEAKLILLRAASLDEKAFFENPDRLLLAGVERRYFRLLRQRLSGYPLSYLTGRKEFWSLSFKVEPGVLIPRPETETLVEKVLEVSSGGRESILDMGTGSGNIAVALAKELPRAQITAVDISRRALRIAEINALDHGCPDIHFVRSNLFSVFESASSPFDIIVSNPPYVSREDWLGFPPEIRKYEPRRALLGGETGLEFIQRLVRNSAAFLRPGGSLLVEIGAGQRKAVLSFFGDEWDGVTVVPDLSLIPRVVAARKKRND